MKLGRGWTQSPPGIAYHETSVLIPLSTEEVRFMEQRVFNHHFLFVSVWLVVVDVFLQYVLSALTCLDLVDNGVFAICVRSPSSLLAGRHVVSAPCARGAARILRAIGICLHFGE